MKENTNNNRINNQPGYKSLELDLDLGRKVLLQAEQMGADSAEVFMILGSDTTFSIENDSVTFSASSTDFGMGIRLIKDKRLGFGYCTNQAGAETAIKTAIAATQFAKRTEFEFPTKQKVKQITSIYDRSILELTVNDGLEFTKQLINAVKEVDTRVIASGGGAGFGSGTVGIINSNGYEFEYSGTGIYGAISAILKDKTISTGFEYDQSRRNDLNMSEIGKLASELAVKGQNPETVTAGDCTVVFKPHAFAELLEFTVIPGLYGEAANKGETPYSNMIGEMITLDDISLIDDGTLKNGINTSPVDDEGTPTRRNILAEKGELKKYLFDRQAAEEFGSESTGNALRAEGYSSGKNYKALPKTKAFNFTIEGRTKDYDKLISELDSAIVIHQLLGSHTANPASGDFSVNSPTLFKVENGEITSAGKQVMLSGNMPEIMKKILQLGDDYKMIGGGLSPVAQFIPSVVIDSLKVI